MSIISAVVSLGLLIFIHELGHFLVAKRAGVGVEVFSLGFGPRLLGFKKGETDYRLSLIPLGGFVRMVGENPEAEVEPEDIEKSFSHKPLRWRVAIVAAGPFSNLLLALVIFFMVLIWAGIPSLTTLVGDVQPGQPAQLAGIQKGDRILAINGQGMRDWGDIVQTVQQNQARPMQVTLARGKEQITVTLSPRPVVAKDIFGDEKRVYRVGIIGSKETFTRPVGFMEALTLSFEETYLAGDLIFTSIAKVARRDIPMDSIGGPILIAQIADQAAQHGLVPLLRLVALISVNLAVINLLPIPALDGGHLFFFLIEGIRRKPLTQKARGRAQQVGMTMLLLLMAVIFYNDIARLVGGAG